MHRFPGWSLRRLSASGWALVIAVLATVIAYLPTLDAPLYLDDYIYLNATEQLSFARYARVSFTPWSHEPLLPFTRDFWRPLSFLYFEMVAPVFGGRVLPYHVANLAVHLSAIVLVWLLARRLDARPLVAGVAVVVFALYPGSTEAVSWISSVNSAALPLSLGCWLAFLAATKGPETNWRLAGCSTALFVLGLGFRETAATVVVPLGLWYVLVQRRDRLGDLAIYRALIPFAVVLGGYYLLRTRLFTEPAANPDIYGFTGNFDNFWWYYIKNALLPFRDPVLGWRVHTQDLSGAILLGLIPVALWKRRWGLVALLLAIPISVVPTAAALLGAGQRYFYFMTPELAVALGMVAAELRSWSADRVAPWLLGAAAGVGAAAAACVAGGYIVLDRNQHWEEIGPTREQVWVDELRAEYPTLPSRGTLYCVNIPLELAIFGAANLEPAVRWYYPDVGHAVWAPEQSAIPALGPDDRVFIAGDGKLLGDTRPQR